MLSRLFLLLGALFLAAQTNSDLATRLWQYRNLGKAFYENPTTQNECVAEFKKALELEPNSLREKLNYGLALVRAANNPEGLKLLEEVQRLDPKLPHTWFNLGIHWKKQGDAERAIPQFQQMVKLVPGESKGWYNLGASLKLGGQTEEALKAFERAAQLDSTLAAARFQLYNAYRAAGRMPEAQGQLKEFQRLKKLSEGAAIGEDVDWCDYAEIYDPQPTVLDAAVVPVYRDQILPGLVKEPAMAVLDSRGIGRADLLVSTGTVLRLHRFGLPALDIAAMSDVRALAPADFNNDGLPDVLALTGSGPRLLRNSRLGFAPVAVKWPAGNFRAAVWLDFDHDYDLDLFLLGDQSVLLRNEGAAGFAPHAFPFENLPLRAAEFVRLRPDSRAFDLLTVTMSGETIVYEDQLGGVYKAVRHPELMLSSKLEADFNQDGRMDTADVSEGKIRLRLNTVGRNWIRVQLEGVRNPKLAPDAWVEVKAGTLYRRVRYQGVPLLFSLGAATEADTVRITWPNGLIQNETRQKANGSYRYKEAQRLSGSCPIIWTWNGAGFEYVTDVLGVAPLGAAAGDGTYFAADHDEYVQLPASMRARDGYYEVRLTEELSEAAYIDQISLLAVDHAANEDLYTSEKWKSPPFPDLKLYGVRQYLPLRKAVDQDGRDVTARLAAKDLSYPDGFRRSMSGIAERHYLTLDFAAAPDDSLLILHGWVDWADGSTFLQAAQEGQGGLVAPQLQVKDARGQWVTVLDDMGMPAGKPKTIAVEMRGLWRSNSREVRIVTNLCVYWDQIRLGTAYRILPATLQPASLVDASLQFRGFSPSTIHPARKQPERFSYDGATPTSLWNPTPGLYTRYGTVAELLKEVDDRLTVMGSGDEIRLRFSAPALSAGRSRSYLLKVDGWAKDRDANTSNGQTVQPLPFHQMTGYPLGAGERHPDPGYERDYNTRPALRLLRPLLYGPSQRALAVDAAP